MKSTIISDPVNLNKARSLLYTCYVEHLHWDIPKQNPSGIKIQEQTDGNYILTDDYDHYSTWFSITNNNDLLACARLCVNDPHGLLEIERYPATHKNQLLKNIFSKKEALRIVEFNREAVMPHYVNDKKLYLMLLKTIFNYCIDNDYTMLTTCNIRKWVEIYRQIGIKRLNVIFKYFEYDPLPVGVYLAKPSDMQLMVKTINSFLMQGTYAKTSSIS